MVTVRVGRWGNPNRQDKRGGTRDEGGRWGQPQLGRLSFLQSSAADSIGGTLVWLILGQKGVKISSPRGLWFYRMQLGWFRLWNSGCAIRVGRPGLVMVTP